MSGATLRRRLAEENTSLRILLREARLYHGMTLLQTTRKSIKTVAQECGYHSSACFTRNFISYFGTGPSAVTNNLTNITCPSSFRENALNMPLRG